jgi:hypothetical protein
LLPLSPQPVRIATDEMKINQGFLLFISTPFPQCCVSSVGEGNAVVVTSTVVCLACLENLTVELIGFIAWLAL